MLSTMRRCAAQCLAFPTFLSKKSPTMQTFSALPLEEAQSPSEDLPLVVAVDLVEGEGGAARDELPSASSGSHSSSSPENLVIIAADIAKGATIAKQQQATAMRSSNQGVVYQSRPLGAQ